MIIIINFRTGKVSSLRYTAPHCHATLLPPSMFFNHFDSQRAQPSCCVVNIVIVVVIIVILVIIIDIVIVVNVIIIIFIVVIVMILCVIIIQI